VRVLFFTCLSHCPSVLTQCIRFYYRDGPLAYPAGVDPTSQSVCSWSWTGCEGPNDLHTAPHGEIAMNFDDGPAAGTDQLMGFLQSNNQRATHFLIGGNILNNEDAVRRMGQSSLHHMAVHTWSHPSYISSLSNEDIVAELGWTSEIIFQLTGKVPRYWRAPQGEL
jgi:chitin deacetylase